MKNTKRINEKGSVTLIVLVTVLFIVILLSSFLVYTSTKRRAQLKETEEIAKNYDVDMEELYNNLEIGNSENTSITAGEIIKTENNINYVSDGEGNEIPVPVGFSYVGEGTKETGFVIRNDEDLNEFVWIPVKDMPYTYNRHAFVGGNIKNTENGTDAATNSLKIKWISTITTSTSYYHTEALPEDEQTSVNSYGGYYIARYEGGILTERTEKGDATIKPIFQKSTTDRVVYVYNFVTFDEAKSLSEELYSKEKNNVISKLCSSYAWDTALEFIETKNPGWATNSVGGNYSISSGGTGKIQPTGYHSVNNIYDMGGNEHEWTTEKFSRANWPYSLRGGSYSGNGADYPACYRSALPTGDTSIYTCFRITLYL